MQKITIYHNPQCSKSKKTLEILQNKGLDPVIIEYLKTPLNRDQLNTLKSHFTLKDFVRSNEPVFTELGLSLDNDKRVATSL